MSGEGVSVNAMPWARVRGWLGATLGPVAGVALTCALCATAQAGGCEALYYDPAAKPGNPGNDADGMAAGVRRFTELLGRPFSAEFKTDAVGWTDMHYAALLDLPEVVAALCDAGMAADVRLKTTGTGYSPFGDDLDRALAALGHEEFELWTADGETPLMIASMVNARNAAAALAACGADVNAKDIDRWTPLYYAAKRSSHDVAKLLVECGADVDATDDDDLTPLHYAASYNSHDVAKLLVERGADVTKAGGYSGTTPLHYAASRNSHDVAKLLVERGADVDATDDDGRTPLHDAASRYSHAVAKLLVERGADVDATDDDGQTPLHYAASYNSHDVVAKLLVERGADVDATDDDDLTPLHYAASRNSHDVAKLLVERGADVNATDDDGWTPLHAAAWRNFHAPDAYVSHRSTVQAAWDNFLDMAKLLVDHGADVNAKVNSGETLLDIMTAARHTGARSGREAKP